MLHEAVPVLKASNWQITKVGPGFCESVLPLNAATTNQHGTHQAALISLSADYTGGMALTTLLRGVPLTGIHPCDPAEAASLWLVSMNVKYQFPSTGHLIGRCRIPDREHQLIEKRYAQGKRVLVTLPIEFESNGQKVATAELAYFAQPTIQLLGPSKKTSALFEQKIKASARMIAGVRAHESHSFGRQGEHIDSGHSAIAAGPQGELLAQRLHQFFPQLMGMVMARTQHGDEMLRSIPGLKQIVLVGAGLDMRPFRLRDELPHVRYFELDLPEMLAERERVAAMMSGSAQVRRQGIPVNFYHDDVAQALLSASDFDPHQATAVIYEGCSMYFEPELNRKILSALATCLGHKDSRLWVDFVSQDVVEGRSDSPGVSAFLQKKEAMGERFIFGLNRPTAFTTDCGLTATDNTSVKQYLEKWNSHLDDPIFNEYQFVVARS
nr:SAM-dependent methyltransferase [uncultured Rhodoferax sp.]